MINANSSKPPSQDPNRKKGKTEFIIPLASNLLNWRNYLSYLPFVIIGIFPHIVIRFVSFKNALPILIYKLNHDLVGVIGIS